MQKLFLQKTVLPYFIHGPTKASLSTLITIIIIMHQRKKETRNPEEGAKEQRKSFILSPNNFELNAKAKNFLFKQTNKTTKNPKKKRWDKYKTNLNKHTQHNSQM